jgi:hypothetical protein
LLLLLGCTPPLAFADECCGTLIIFIGSYLSLLVRQEERVAQTWEMGF